MPSPPKLGIYSSPPLNTDNTASVFGLVSSLCERVLLPLHWPTLYPAPHGAPWILLHAHSPAARKRSSSFHASTDSSAWATTSPSWCIRRLDRPTDWTTASRVCHPLQCAGGLSTLSMVSCHGYTLRGVRCVCTGITTDEPSSRARPFRPSSRTPSRTRLCVSVCYSSSTVCRTARVSNGRLSNTSMASCCSHGVRRATGAPAARCTAAPV